MYEAFRIFESEISRESGAPVWLTRSIDPNLRWIVETRVDFAAAALEDFDKDKKREKERGVVRWATPVDADGNLIEYGGLTRQEFHQAAIQEKQDLEDGLDIDRVRPPEGYNPSEYGDGVTDLQ